MTDPGRPPDVAPDARREATAKAGWHLGRALTALARDTEVRMVSWTTGTVTGPAPEPASALVLLRALERAAVQAQKEEISRARAAGHSWDAIAEALDLGDGYAVRAEAAFDFATGCNERLDWHWVTWNCPSCGGRITDEGPSNGIAQDERGHSGDCARHAADIAREDAEWQAACADHDKEQQR